MFPRAAVGSVIGIGGTVGAIGGIFMSQFTGYDRRYGRISQELPIACPSYVVHIRCGSDQVLVIASPARCKSEVA